MPCFLPGVGTVSCACCLFVATRLQGFAMRYRYAFVVVPLVVAVILLGIKSSNAAAGNGSSVTMSKSQPTADEISTALGVYIWKLDVALPANAKKISAILHSQEQGK